MDDRPKVAPSGALQLPVDERASPYQPLRVARVVAETADACSIVFACAPPQRAAFAYRPGQFLTLRLPIAGRLVPRCYSLSSAPSLEEDLRVTVKRVPGGRGSNWICDHVRAGDVLDVLAPAGVFTPRSLDGDFLLAAGGSGITPVLSILRSVLARGNGRVLLLYANRDERSVIFRDELQALAAAHADRLVVVHWLDAVQGTPAVAQLRELCRSGHHDTREAFICGPGPFMEAMVSALAGLGMGDERVHVERFVSLPDETSGSQAGGAADAAPADTVSPAVAQARLRVRLDGNEHELSCGGSEPLLDAMLRARLNAPHACRAGLCASCMCRVVEGQVHLRHNESLDQKDLAKGWTLACQALPTTERVCVDFPE